MLQGQELRIKLGTQPVAYAYTRTNGERGGPAIEVNKQDN